MRRVPVGALAFFCAAILLLNAQCLSACAIEACGKRPAAQETGPCHGKGGNSEAVKPCAHESISSPEKTHVEIGVLDAAPAALFPRLHPEAMPDAVSHPPMSGNTSPAIIILRI